MKRTFKILSLDGGGIRGLIQAIILAHIEETTQTPIWKMFDLISGTSTGGIIACALVVPTREGEAKHSAGELISLYREHGKDIFPHTLLKTIRSGKGLFDERYPSDGLKKILSEQYGKTTLADCLTGIIVTAYGLSSREPWLFKSMRAKEDPAYSFPLTDVALSTSAAPTYFEPHEFRWGSTTEYEQESDWLIDGGIYVNNPSICALFEALDAGFSPEDIRMISIGTGHLTRKYGKESRNWGLIQWPKPLLDCMFDGSSKIVHGLTKKLLKDHYLRLDCRLTIGSDDMDNTTESNLHCLTELAKGLIEKKKDEIEKFVEKLDLS